MCVGETTWLVCPFVCLPSFASKVSSQLKMGPVVLGCPIEQFHILGSSDITPMGWRELVPLELSIPMTKHSWNLILKEGTFQEAGEYT